MNDDWRLRIEVHEPETARRLLERLDSSELEHKLETSFGDRVVVSREGSTVFCYAGAREQAEQARAVTERLAGEHGWQIDAELLHWHPTAEAWEDPDKPLPTSDAEQAAEHAQLIARERSEHQPEFEVRVECDSRQAAQELAERLRSEGLSSVHRAAYVLVGAADEDSATALADRIRAEAPPGSTVTAEGTVAAVMSAVGPNPFSVFGGLAG